MSNDGEGGGGNGLSEKWQRRRKEVRGLRYEDLVEKEIRQMRLPRSLSLGCSGKII